MSNLRLRLLQAVPTRLGCTAPTAATQGLSVAPKSQSIAKRCASGARFIRLVMVGLAQAGVMLRGEMSTKTVAPSEPEPELKVVKVDADVHMVEPAKNKSSARRKEPFLDCREEGLVSGRG